MAFLRIDRNKYGPWALVTGASDGIGQAIAHDLAADGFDLVLVARRRSKLEALAAELSTQHGIQTQVIAADLSDPTAVAAVIAAVQGTDIGLLVAAAGYGSSGYFLDQPLDQELNMLDLNTRAVAAMAHHFGQRFAQQGRGGIILFSSLVAFQGVPMSANYAATKAYIQSFAEALHAELAPLGVDVLATAPGPIHSGFAARADMQMGAALTPETVSNETLRALGRRATVRPGLLTKFLLTSLAFLPRGRRVWAMGRVMGGMTKHQQTAVPSAQEAR